MCKKTIEKAGTINKEATVVWDVNTKMATLTFDSKKTNQDAILKRIALAGYDNEQFLAPDDVYANLHGCCQYEREAKTAVKPHEHHTTVVVTTPEAPMDHSKHVVTAPKAETKKEQQATAVVTTPEAPKDHSKHVAPAPKVVTKIQKTNMLLPVFEAYFSVKDAMIQSDGSATATKGKLLLAAIEKVDMNQLGAKEHDVWMQVLRPLKQTVQKISETKNIGTQRGQLDLLSKNMLNLAKVSKWDFAIYNQHCPMANDGKGGNWLSKQNTIKNPYYGSKMMTCGSTVETLK
ncbi:hypothetical protein GCM10011343_23370 [Flavobacterium orientale]|uniref:DUF3347 domain-containing protein n=2 Tax=Flavobacterium orientale TaxID=1756020 RepID=A0A917DE08_9FLAO|nr:hypothetical protein GCM10011343_23370 [Flavobacterium orientale]